MQIVFLGNEKHGLGGQGKQYAFLLAAQHVLPQFGHRLYCLTKIEELQTVDSHLPTLVCLIYNEENEIDCSVFAREQAVKERFGDLRIVHGVQQGILIGDKAKTLDLFETHGVATPKVLRTADPDTAAFSRTPLGSGLPVSVTPAGVELPSDKLNTHYVDTRFRHNGDDYYVCLRFMCFWKRHVATYVRCRPTSDGNASVHAANTPADADLLNHIYSELVMPRTIEIQQLCYQAGTALGPGFYSHDVLPDANNSKFLICETGFKFDESALNPVLRTLSGKILMTELFHGIESLRMAYTFAQDLDNIVKWTEIYPT